MQLVSLLTLSVGLAMDATAVAATKGFATRRVRLSQVMKVALLFGGFQGGMPVIGWAVGARLIKLIDAWDHWIAAALLAGIGGKMLWEVWRGEDAEAKDTDDLFAWGPLVVLAVATSIDALVAGLTIHVLDTHVAVAALVIGATTAVLSAAGLYLGHRFGARIGKKLDVFGGLLLIGLGAKVLLEGLASR